MKPVLAISVFLVYVLKLCSSVTCPPECICLSQSQVLCNTGGLTEIPLKMLPPTVEHLSLTKNHFPVIRSDAFTGLRHLRKLSLDGNNITTIKPFAFRGLPRLRELSIQHTPLTTVAQFAFAGLQNITAILLGHNKIQKVEGYAFAGTSNVRLLLLNNNPIQKVETSAFSGLTNVEHLLLPSGIKTLEADAFSGLDSVGLIKLPFMDLQALKPNTFRGLSHVHVLAIQESDLGTIKSGAFDGLNHIGSLNVYNNKIDSIQEFHIKPNNKVKIIRFHGNHLLESPRGGAISIEGVETLSVTANHFPCDCHIHSLLDGPFGNSTAGDFRTKNFCISPLEVNGKAIAELDVESIARCQEEVTRGNWDAPSRATSLPTLVSVCLTVLVACGVS
ncbi:chondroadherin [Macrosteles quadrilineatus]|uniref:chondroadherin n=1 Tax=Macrosteles quadrilineatus TaxID=74068 RepID=UPI0023E32DF7|nr:chondroadherin [Macrosteles quadrilineatus]